MIPPIGTSSGHPQRLDVYARPVSYCFLAFAQKIGHRLLALWVEIIPVGLLFLFVFKIRLVPAEPGWALFSLGLSFVLVFLTNYCIGITAFWLTKTEGIRRAFLTLRNLSAGMLIPELPGVDAKLPSICLSVHHPASATMSGRTGPSIPRVVVAGGCDPGDAGGRPVALGRISGLR